MSMAMLARGCARGDGRTGQSQVSQALLRPLIVTHSVQPKTQPMDVRERIRVFGAECFSK